MTIDVDATLITAHSEKEQGARNHKGGYGFHSLQAYVVRPRTRWAVCCGRGTRAPKPSKEHKIVIDLALGQIPAGYIESVESLVPADSDGATHGLIDYCRDANMRF